MSRTFNGTDNQVLRFNNNPLSAAIGSGGLGLDDYPVLFAAWIKPDAAAASYTVMGTAKDNSSSDNLILRASGGVANDPVSAYVEKSSSNGRADSTAAFSTTEWRLAFARFNSTVSREAGILELNGSAVNKGSNTDSVSPSFGGMEHFYVGCRYYGGYYDRFSGKIGQCALWQGTVPDDADLVTMALQSDWSGIDAAGLIDIWTMDASGNETGTVNGIVLSDAGSTAVGTDAGDNPDYSTGASYSGSVGALSFSGAEASVTIYTSPLIVARHLENYVY